MVLARHYPFVALVLLRFGLVPLLHGGIFARVHDNLDSTLVYNVLTAAYWRGGMDPGAFGVLLGGTLDWMNFATLTWPLHLVYVALPPEHAYALTELGTVILGYAGMYLLLSRAGIGPGIAGLMGCLFAMSMGFSTQGLGVAGAPLIAHWALHGRRGAGVLGAAVLLGWNSSLIGHAMFLPVVVGVLAAMLGRSLRGALPVLGAHLAGAVIGAVPLFAFVLSGREGHRSGWAMAEALDLAGAPGALLSNLLTQGSWYHATITPALYTGVFLIAGLVLVRRAAWLTIGVICAAVALSVAAPVLRQALPGPLASIQFDRIGQFAAVLVVVLGALALRQSGGQGGWARWLRGATVLTLVQAMLVWGGINTATLREVLPPAERQALRATFRAEGFQAAWRQADLSPARIWLSVPTVRRHMRTDDYACIRATVGDGAVVSAGPDPMLAPLHGIRALDGYHYLYPASWHAAFRTVIVAKIEASDAVRKAYDGWGNRVSLFIDQVPGILPDFAAARRLGASVVIADRPLPLVPIRPECALSDDLRLYLTSPP